MNDPRLNGYSEWKGYDAFEDHVGPLYYKKNDAGYRGAFVVRDYHVNGQGAVHGGMLMTFADYAIFIIAWDSLRDRSGVTITFTAEFTAMAVTGDFVEAVGEVIRETGSLIFLKGSIVSGDTVLMNFSAVIKKLGKRERERSALGV